MEKGQTESGVIPFGAEEAQAPVAAADGWVAFLESAALPLVAALVVSAFLIYQFGRWFLANYRVTGMDDLMGDRERPSVPAAQRPAEGGRRPWSAKSGDGDENSLRALR